MALGSTFVSAPAALPPTHNYPQPSGMMYRPGFPAPGVHVCGRVAKGMSWCFSRYLFADLEGGGSCTREKVGGTFHLSFQYNMYSRMSPPFFPRAVPNCGAPLAP
jgi:hypothetical protein